MDKAAVSGRLAAFGGEAGVLRRGGQRLLTEDTDRYVMTETSVSKSDYTLGDLFDEHSIQRLVDSATGVTVSRERFTTGTFQLNRSYVLYFVE